MVLRASLGSLSLNPFGGAGVDFGAFNISGGADLVDPSKEAYLNFSKVEVEWEAGRTSNDVYMAALQAYANSKEPGTAEYVNAQARVEATQYRLQRDALTVAVQAGAASPAE